MAIQFPASRLPLVAAFDWCIACNAHLTLSLYRALTLLAELEAGASSCMGNPKEGVGDRVVLW
eukprot:4299847-Amphidinium_carterae.2